MKAEFLHFKSGYLVLSVGGIILGTPLWWVYKRCEHLPLHVQVLILGIVSVGLTGMGFCATALLRFANHSRRLKALEASGEAALDVHLVTLFNREIETLRSERGYPFLACFFGHVEIQRRTSQHVSIRHAVDHVEEHVAASLPVAGLNWVLSALLIAGVGCTIYSMQDSLPKLGEAIRNATKAQEGSTPNLDTSSDAEKKNQKLYEEKQMAAYGVDTEAFFAQVRQAYMPSVWAIGCMVGLMLGRTITHSRQAQFFALLETCGSKLVNITWQGSQAANADRLASSVDSMAAALGGSSGLQRASSMAVDAMRGLSKNFDAFAGENGGIDRALAVFKTQASKMRRTAMVDRGRSARLANDLMTQLKDVTDSSNVLVKDLNTARSELGNTLREGVAKGEVWAAKSEQMVVSARNFVEEGKNAVAAVAANVLATSASISAQTTAVTALRDQVNASLTATQTAIADRARSVEARFGAFEENLNVSVGKIGTLFETAMDGVNQVQARTGGQFDAAVTALHDRMSESLTATQAVITDRASTVEARFGSFEDNLNVSVGKIGALFESAVSGVTLAQARMGAQFDIAVRSMTQDMDARGKTLEARMGQLEVIIAAMSHSVVTAFSNAGQMQQQFIDTATELKQLSQENLATSRALAKSTADLSLSTEALSRGLALTLPSLAKAVETSTTTTSDAVKAATAALDKADDVLAMANAAVNQTAQAVQSMAQQSQLLQATMQLGREGIEQTNARLGQVLPELGAIMTRTQAAADATAQGAKAAAETAQAVREQVDKAGRIVIETTPKLMQVATAAAGAVESRVEEMKAIATSAKADQQQIEDSTQALDRSVIQMIQAASELREATHRLENQAAASKASKTSKKRRAGAPSSADGTGNGPMSAAVLMDKILEKLRSKPFPVEPTEGEMSSDAAAPDGRESTPGSAEEPAPEGDAPRGLFSRAWKNLRNLGRTRGDN